MKPLRDFPVTIYVPDDDTKKMMATSRLDCVLMSHAVQLQGEEPLMVLVLSPQPKDDKERRFVSIDTVLCVLRGFGEGMAKIFNGTYTRAKFIDDAERRGELDEPQEVPDISGIVADIPAPLKVMLTNILRRKIAEMGKQETASDN